MTHSNSLDEHSALIVRDFLASEWSRFSQFVRENCGTDEEAEKEAELIYRQLGGED
ncbi:hypothetical protein IFY47_003369 [Salmonella enterica]|nr:hypothetical protein [Salmonella enterica]EJD1942435.1 hypothetical protein [Escherichia coli]EHF0215313.1 hypothetical protein [Salmonella enterica]EJM1834577.1 hypothetical protein [Salmonella enterica]EJT3914035.1 hypothetical protein [Salmonella enterica]